MATEDEVTDEAVDLTEVVAAEEVVALAEEEEDAEEAADLTTEAEVVVVVVVVPHEVPRKPNRHHRFSTVSLLEATGAADTVPVKAR